MTGHEQCTRGEPYLLQDEGTHPYSCCHQHAIIGRGKLGPISQWAIPQGVPSPADDGTDGVVGNTLSTSTIVAETISGHVWCITAADNGIWGTPDGIPSTWGFEYTRHRRCAVNGRGTTPDIRACAAAAAASTAVVYHAPDCTTNGIRVTATTTCIKGALSIVDTALPSNISARLSPSYDTATAISYLSILQVTHSIIDKSVTAITAAAAVAHGWPSLDSDTSLDIECSPYARNAIADSGQDGRSSTPKAVTDDDYTNDGGKGSGTRIDARISSVATTDTTADA